MKKTLLCTLIVVTAFVVVAGFVSCSDEDDVPVTINKVWFVADAGNYVYDFTDETNCRTGYLQENGKVYPMGRGSFMFDRVTKTSGIIMMAQVTLCYRNLTAHSVEFYEKAGGAERIIGTGVTGKTFEWEVREE